MAKVNPEIETFARIKVIGIGGSGKNALNHMIETGVDSVEFICMNTDTQDLHHSSADKKIHIGRNLTKGLGSGMNPDVGRQSAEETKAEIQEALKGADMVFIACGMGGGTGTGAAPVIARIAKEQGILTVAVVTKPFSFEGQQRSRIADAGLDAMEKEVDALIVIPNDRLLSITAKDTSFKDAFAMCDEILRQAVEGISELITTPGIINIDFADIKAVMSDAGSAFMGIGTASGENRAEEAAYSAINSPLLDIAIAGAKGVLFAISGGDDLTMHEVHQAAKIVTESVDSDAKVIFGTIHDDTLKKGELKITVIATGFNTNPAGTKKSLFGGAPQPVQRSVPIQTMSGDKEKESPIKEIRKEPAPTPEKKPAATLEEISDDDDSDGWDVPAFLRRGKK
ncbi:MAG: cell division protein FtsZ [Candidatus Pacebacteria bacterium]|nr:cell division protein FtsZ [Candidatus Paceibacterota bacterium]